MNCWKKNKGLYFSIIGILMMLFGVLRGELGTLFLKATNICLECIGIG